MNYIPQGAMHRMRAGFADGAPVRNRSFEQQHTRSGNPNMPIFNTPQRQTNDPTSRIPIRSGMGKPWMISANHPNAQSQGLAGQAQGLMGQGILPNMTAPSGGYFQQLMQQQAAMKPADSFHRRRPPMAPIQGGPAPQQAVMPQTAPAAEQGVWSDWFGRYLPIRARG